MGAIVYIYYGIYKMFFVHFDLSGCDFMTGYYAAENFMNGRPLYSMPPGWQPYFYPPIATSIFIPFTCFPPKTATLAWLLITHLLVLSSLALAYLCHSMEDKMDSAVAASIAFGLSFPLFVNILVGNITILIFFCITLIYYSLFFRKDHIIPYLLSVCTFFKVYPAFFMFFYLRNKDWKVLFRFILTCFVIGLISLGIFGTKEHFYFVSKLPDLNHYVGVLHCASFSYFLKLFFPQYSNALYALANGLFLLFLLILWLYCCRQNKSFKPVDDHRTTMIHYFIMTAIIIMIVPSSWLTYHTLYIVPFYFIIYSWLHNRIHYKYFSIFLIIFVLINLWEPIAYHLPVTLDGLTISELSTNKNEHSIMYPLFYGIPFILNMVFFFWLLLNFHEITEGLRTAR